MTSAEALHKFYKDISGLDMYPVNSVPDHVKLPYGTYEKSVGESVPVTVRMYFYTESEKTPDECAERFCEPLRHGGKNVLYDDGCIWINLGNPEWYGSTGEDDTSIKVRTINLINDYE